MDKLERLACLYLTFLNHPEGLSFSAIKKSMPLAYEGEAESARRKFERDKDDLKTMGMSLQHISPGDPLPGGQSAGDHLYLPEGETRFLPDPGLSTGEARILSDLLFKGIEDCRRNQDSDEAILLESLARKLLFQHPSAFPDNLNLEEDSPFSAFPEVEKSDPMSIIYDSLQTGHRIEFQYPGQEGGTKLRDVEGRGLISHRGRWCLVAHNLPDRQVKMYYLDRMEEVRKREEKNRPAPGFRLKNYSLHPLALSLEPEVTVTLKLHPDGEEGFLDFLKGLPEQLGPGIEPDRIWFRTTNPRAIYSWIVKHPGMIEAMGPETVREGFINYLNKMKELHSSESSL